MTISQQPNLATFCNTIESAVVRFMLDSAGRSSMSLNKITNGERRLLVPPSQDRHLIFKIQRVLQSITLPNYRSVQAVRLDIFRPCGSPHRRAKVLYLCPLAHGRCSAHNTTQIVSARLWMQRSTAAHDCQLSIVCMSLRSELQPQQLCRRHPISMFEDMNDMPLSKTRQIGNCTFESTALHTAWRALPVGHGYSIADNAAEKD